MVKKSACNEGDLGLILRSGRSPGEGHGNPLKYPCLDNPMDRGTRRFLWSIGHKELDTTEVTSLSPIRTKLVLIVVNNYCVGS